MARKPRVPKRKRSAPAKRKKTITRDVAGRALTAEVAQVFVADVGEYATPASELARAELAMAADLALDGPATGETFRFMRGALGVQAKDLASSLGVAPETVSRWETGARDVDRAAWLLLGSLVLERAGKPQAVRERMERIAAHV